MIAVLTPITSPRESSKGPPELPGLSAASVWITSGTYTHLRAHETPAHLVWRPPRSTLDRSSAASDVYKRQVLTPITSPRESSKGPPELPGLSAASVWIT